MNAKTTQALVPLTFIALTLWCAGCSTEQEAPIPTGSATEEPSELDDAAPEGESKECPFVPAWEINDQSGAVEVPLEVICGPECATLTLDQMEALWECPADVEERAHGMERTVGCGRIMYEEPYRSRRIYDAQSGQLLGAAESSDVSVELSGTECDAAAFVGGLWDATCEEGEVVRCERY